MEFRTPHRRGTRSRLGIASAIVALVVLAVAGALVGTRIVGGPAPTPVPTPEPRLMARAAGLRTHPEVPQELHEQLTSELESFLVDLYERAFLPPLPPPTPAPEAPASPVPTPIPRPPVADLFTAEAAAALADSESVYGTGRRETVFRGDVAFAGIVTVQGEGATDALLNITFDGRGRIEIEPADLEEGELGRYHDMRLHQSGRVQAIRTAEGWRISGFDLALRADELIPATPAPEAAAYRAARARWTP